MLELRAIATVRGVLRADLLAEQAGLLLGASDRGGPHAAHQALAGELLVEAGADLKLLPRWRAEGRRRQMPLSWALAVTAC